MEFAFLAGKWLQINGVKPIISCLHNADLVGKFTNKKGVVHQYFILILYFIFLFALSIALERYS